MGAALPVLPGPGASAPALSGAARAASSRSLPAPAVLGASAQLTSRPPKALPPRKARTAAECEHLEQLPNIGPAIAADLRLIGIQHPQALAEADAMQLYQRLCTLTGKRHDPCVLDTFMAATDFMRGAEPRAWWLYTAQRKAQHGVV
jgi:Pathogenicity locus